VLVKPLSGVNKFV